MAAQPPVPGRVPASASPIVSDHVATIRMTLSVSLLTQPNDRGNLRLDAASGLIPDGAFFGLRYLVHGRARRAVVQTLRVTEAGGGRDLVTVRIISDGAAAARAEQRQVVGVTGRARRISDDPVEAVRAFAVQFADISRTGVALSSEVPLAAGDRIALELTADEGSVDVEVVRHDEEAVAPFGARFLDAAAGEQFFARVLGAIWTEPPRVVEDMVGEAPKGERPWSGGSGMRTRRAS